MGLKSFFQKLESTKKYGVLGIYVKETSFTPTAGSHLLIISCVSHFFSPFFHFEYLVKNLSPPNSMELPANRKCL